VGGGGKQNGNLTSITRVRRAVILGGELTIVRRGLLEGKNTEEEREENSCTSRLKRREKTGRIK